MPQSCPSLSASATGGGMVSYPGAPLLVATAQRRPGPADRIAQDGWGLPGRFALLGAEPGDVRAVASDPTVSRLMGVFFADGQRRWRLSAPPGPQLGR